MSCKSVLVRPPVYLVITSGPQIYKKNLKYRGPTAESKTLNLKPIINQTNTQ